MELDKGDKVTYVPEHGKRQIGVVKSKCADSEHVFVVYNCGGDWDHFDEYTAARTNIKYLIRGWQPE